MKRVILGTVLTVLVSGLVVAGKAQVPPTGEGERAVLTAKDRGVIARHLVMTFASDVRMQGQDVRAWGVKLGRAVGLARPANAARAARMPTLESAMAVLMGQPLDSSSIQKVLSASADQITPASLGDPVADLVYTPLPSGRCRVADSRVISSPMTAGLTRGIDVESISSYASQGGNGSSAGDGSTNCGIPDFTAGLVVSVTVLPTSSFGFFKIFANNQVFTDGNTVQWSNSGGTTNDVIVKSCQSCADEISIYANSSTHYVIDVLGYFMRPQATALDCVDVAGTATTIPPGPNSFTFVTAPACTAGYTQTSFNCDTSNFNTILAGQRATSRQCFFTNQTSGTYSATASVRCCRVPGR